MRQPVRPSTGSTVAKLDGKPILRAMWALVADFHRTLINGGIYMYPPDANKPNGKLRLMCEANPLAFLAEQAGGKASDGHGRILERVPDKLHARTPLYIGSTLDVEAVENLRPSRWQIACAALLRRGGCLIVPALAAMANHMLCLGIESSCDETALALVEDGRLVDAVLASQADVHALFGGVVPELASREHYRFVGALFDELMRRSGKSNSDIDLVASARGPGLLGSLLVGVAFAKGLALGLGKPFLGVNHLLAHLLAVGLSRNCIFLPLACWCRLGIRIFTGLNRPGIAAFMHTLMTQLVALDKL